MEPLDGVVEVLPIPAGDPLPEFVVSDPLAAELAADEPGDPFDRGVLDGFCDDDLPVAFGPSAGFVGPFGFGDKHRLAVRPGAVGDGHDDLGELPVFVGDGEPAVEDAESGGDLEPGEQAVTVEQSVAVVTATDSGKVGAADEVDGRLANVDLQ
jgi:hypothetical protein